MRPVAVQGETDEPSLVALFTFVARDPLTGRAMAINSLDPATETDRARFADRQQIAQQRRAARKATATTLPTDELPLLWLFMRQASHCNIMMACSTLL